MRVVRDMEGINVNGENITNIRYADETALRLHDFMDNIATECGKLELLSNVMKTYCIAISKKKETPKCQSVVNRLAIQQVKQFSYFGSILTIDGRCDTKKKKDWSGKESVQRSSK